MHKMRFKGAMKSCFMSYSCSVIILLNTDLCKSAFSTYSFKNQIFVFLCSVSLSVHTKITNKLEQAGTTWNDLEWAETT